MRPYFQSLLLDEETAEIRGPFDRFPRQHLTPHEFRVLRRLTRSHGIVTDWELQEAVWVAEYAPADYREQVKGIVFALRQKLRAAGWGEADVIVTRPGQGRLVNVYAIVNRLNAISNAESVSWRNLFAGAVPPGDEGGVLPPSAPPSSTPPQNGEHGNPKD